MITQTQTRTDSSMLDFVTVFEASSLEGEFDGFTRTIDDEDDEIRTNAEYNVNNQTVTQTIVERDGVTEMIVKVDGEIVKRSEVGSPEEFVDVVARNTFSSTA